MKKGIKKIVSLAVSAAILGTGFPLDGFNIGASAAEQLSSTIEYDVDGYPILIIEASEENYSIRYTVDGSVPSINSLVYDYPVAFSKETVVRVAEFDENGNRISGIKRTLTPKTAPISFFVEQDYDLGKAYVTIECRTVGSDIYYTTDGSKPSQESALYTEPLEFTENTKLRARAYCDGYNTTTTYLRNVKIKKYIEEETEVEVKDPEEISKESNAKLSDAVDNAEPEKTESEKEETVVVEKDKEEKTVSAKVDYRLTYVDEDGVTYVNFMKQKASNIIYYTTDGSAVSKSSKKYTKRVKFSEPGVIRAKEYTKAGKLVAALTYNVKTMCKPVEYSCIDFAAGTRTIAMSTKTEGATIYYTTDGTSPNIEYANIYKDPIVVGNKVDICAVAVKDGYRKGVATHAKAAAVPVLNDDFNFSDAVYSETAKCFNDYRRANGRSDLVLDEKLTEAAFTRAKELAVMMSHTRPDGTNYVSICAETNLNIKYSVEFIASRHETPQEFFDSILKEDGGDKQVLGDGYDINKLGIGYYEKNDKRYWVAIIAWAI